MLLALAVSGVVATGLSVERARADARERDRQAVGLVAERLSAGLLTTVSSLRGNDVLASDDTVDAAEFASLAGDVVPGSEFDALAYAQIVDGDDRAAWEAEAGATILDTDGDGGFTPSPPRDRYVVVRFVEPTDDTTRALIGFDFLSDPLRARAVEEATVSDTAVIVGPLRLAASGQPGLFVADAVRDRGGDVVGVVAGGIRVDRILTSAEGLDDITPISLWLDDQLLVGDGEGRTTVFSVGGRRFTVASGDARGANWLLPSIIGLGTMLLGAGTVITARRERRERERQRWLSRRNQRLAEFAERLAVASSVDDVATITVDHAGPIIGADGVSVGRRDTVDPSKLVVEGDVSEGHVSEGGPRRTELHPIDAGTPLTDCVRRAAPVVLVDLDAYRREYGRAVDALHDTGTRAAICVPLGLGSESPSGAIGYGFRQVLRTDHVDDLVATAQLVAQMVGRALERARVRDVVQGRVDLLGELARALTSAGTRDEVAEVVSTLLPSVLDVRRAVLAPADQRPDEASTRSYTPQSTDDVQLHLVLDDAGTWNGTYESLTQAVLEFVDGAWVRAALYDHEHSVLVRLQASLLTTPPEVEGFDVAVAYRSAMEAVGIGGDWYSVIASDDSVFVVIGDIAGHGPGAVAHMAEVKTVMRHLLSTGSSIEQAIGHAQASLERRHAYASAIVVQIDRRAERLRFLNAGHPSPIVIGADGTVSLHQQHRPWLGVPGELMPATEVPFGAGSTLLLYTDGLVEERGELIDVSMQRLADLVARHDREPASLVEFLLERRATHRGPSTVDDDIALVAVARR